jgi:type II secretory pathway component PulL
VYGIAIYGEEVRISKISHEKVEHHNTALTDAADFFKKVLREENAIVSSALPIKDTLLLNFNIPLSSKKKALQVLPSMLDVQLPFPLEDCLYKVVSSRKLMDNTLSFTTIIVRRKIMERHLAFLQENGVVVDHLDSEATVLFEEGSLVFPKSKKIVVINMERESISVIISEEQAIKSAYTLKVERDKKNEELDLWLKRITKIENLNSQHFDMVITGKDASSILAGEIARKLSSSISPEVSIMPDSEFAFTETIAKRLITPKKYTLNFLEDEYEPKRAKECKMRLMRMRSLFLLAVSVALIFINSLHYIFWYLKKSNLEQAIASLSQKIMPETRLPKGMEIFEINRKMLQHSEEIQPLVGIVANQTFSTFSSLLANIAKKNLIISNLTINDKQIVISGNSTVWQDCEELANWLKTKGFTVTLEKKSFSTFNTTQFAIKADKRQKQQDF